MKQETQNPLQQSENIEITNDTKVTNHNGFTQCPPLTQILPPTFIILSTIQLTSFLFFINSQSFTISVIVVNYILFGVLSYFWVLTTKIDPTDTVQIKHRYHLQNKLQFDKSLYKFFCSTCKTCVGNNSFHCKKCHRCVELFDHHCKWLNNCIGAKNYFQFVILVGVSLLFVMLHFIIHIWFCIYFSNKVQNQWRFYSVIFWVILDIVPLASLGWLMSLHTYLMIYKKSTIALIMDNRQKNKIHPQKHHTNQSTLKPSLFRLNISPFIQDKTKKHSKSSFNFNQQVKVGMISEKMTNQKQNKYPIKLKPITSKLTK